MYGKGGQLHQSAVGGAVNCRGGGRRRRGDRESPCIEVSIWAAADDASAQAKKKQLLGTAFCFDGWRLFFFVIPRSQYASVGDTLLRSQKRIFFRSASRSVKHRPFSC